MPLFPGQMPIGSIPGPSPFTPTAPTATVPPGYVMTPYGLVPISALTGTTTTPTTNTPVTPKSEGDTTNTGGGSSGGGGGSSGGGGGGTDTTTTPPPPYEFTPAISGMIQRNQAAYQDPAYTLPYGNYGPQFPNLGTQIGSAMYTNIQPRQYTPSWMKDRLPPRLGYQIDGQLDPNSPYITGRKMGNYGQLFQKFGAAPQGPFGITPGGGGQQGPFGGGAYQNLTQPFNPYPINGYDPSTSLNVRSAPNPYLANQQGGTAYGGLGGLLQQRNLAAAAAPPPSGPNNTSLGATGGNQSPAGGNWSEVSPGPDGVVNLTGGEGPPTWQVPLLNYLSQNPQLRGLLGF